MTIFRMISTCVVVAAMAANLLAQDNANGAGTFNPKDLHNLEMKILQ